MELNVLHPIRDHMTSSSTAERQFLQRSNNLFYWKKKEIESGKSQGTEKWASPRLRPWARRSRPNLHSQRWEVLDLQWESGRRIWLLKASKPNPPVPEFLTKDQRAFEEKKIHYLSKAKWHRMVQSHKSESALILEAFQSQWTNILARNRHTKHK